MANNYGPGVSRVLDPAQSGFKTVIWQAGKPPLDAELNLIADIAAEQGRLQVLKGSPSGWYGDALNPQDSFVTSSIWSNWFQFGPQFSGETNAIPWAVVNGWVIPVTGTLTGSPPGSPDNTDTWNRITLPPPPANTGDARIDFVFLEAWLARIPPNPATTNKPAASAVWRYGNVEGGYSFLSDDLQDPNIGFETTQRVQVQYRIRVVSGLVGLASFPDGFDPSVVKGRGAATTDTSFVFQNMREVLGDPGLWRAGDGTPNSLGTVDGYSYAIPLCVVFRRNSVAWSGAPSQNLNGSLNRNPTAVDRTGFKTFATVPTISGSITNSSLSLSLASVANIPLPLTPASPIAIQIGDEIMLYSAITGSTMTISSRGAFGTVAEAHPAGSTIRILSGRPDGLFADQIASKDILDLRHSVNPGGFDYQAVLKGSLDRLLRGQLAATWKRSGGGPQGRFVAYQDIASASPGPLGVTQLDAPDGVREVWSDAAVLQPVVIPIAATPSTGTAVAVGGTLGNTYTVTVNTLSGGPNGYHANDVITIPKSQFLGSLPGSDADQLSFVTDATFIKIRFMGDTTDIPTSQYSVGTSSGNLQITFGGSFPGKTATGAFLTIYLQYGPGRGTSRRPDAVHSVAYLSGSPNLALRPVGVPTDNQELSTAWAPLWSKFRSNVFNGQLPTTAEALVDPGSKTLVLTPFRLQQMVQLFGNSNFKTIQKWPSSDATNGAMPANTPTGGPKWGSTDPLGLFSGYSDPTTARSNMVVIVPRKLMPGWGAVHSPILSVDVGNIDQGINYGIFAPKGSVTASVSNYVPMVNGSVSYGVFSTSIGYNTAGTISGVPVAGMRFFTDSRGMGRHGLELPPYYAFARVFAVYQLSDYTTNGSAFDPITRQPTGGGAVNLLRQNFVGPSFFIEQDTDGDPTCILNADVIDISKAPTPIANFGSGTYVIEASIFGADRNAFDLGQDCRIVLARGRSEGLTAGVTLTNPDFLLPGAPLPGDEVSINYSREVYQGDAWFSQTVGSDSNYLLGPIPTATRYQLMNTSLDYPNLARSNEKVLEVLAGMAFQTTLGTGRLSGDLPSNTDDFRNVGWEPWTVPATPVDARPTLVQTALLSTERFLSVGSEYLGCTTRLPLGALFRDKDFRGNAIGGNVGGTAISPEPRQLVVGEWNGPATAASGIAPQNTEHTLAPVHAGSMASGNGGEVVVHGDGNQGNYGILTSYRTTRGGTAFTMSGVPGGDLGAVLSCSPPCATFAGILSGVAMLVRNVPTDVGSNEVSAGQELMMLVITSARTIPSAGAVNTVQIGASGTGEGYSAADLYRIPGHPITNDSARTTKDPATVALQRKGDFLT